MTRPAAKRVEPQPAADDLAARLVEDLAIFDSYESGLAAKLAGYVLDGSNADVLPTITAIDRSDDERVFLIVRHYRHPHMRGHSFDYREYDDRAAEIAYAARSAILFGPTSLPALRRFADIAARVYLKDSTFPGSDGSPLWFRAFIDCVSEQARNRSQPLDLGALTASRVGVLLDLEQQSIAVLVDCCFVGGSAKCSDGTVAIDLPGLGGTLTSRLEAAWPRISTLTARARALLFQKVTQERDPASLYLLMNGMCDSARTVREAAREGIKAMPPDEVRSAARPLLADDAAARREVAIDMLAAIGDLDTLATHARTETSKVLLRKLAQSTARTAAATEIGAANPPDGPDGYTALDGTWVAAPALLPDADTLPADAAAAIASLNWMKEQRSPNVAIGPDCPGRIVALMNGEIDPPVENRWLWESVEREPFLAICARPDVSITCLTRLCLAGQDDRGWFGLPRNLIQDQFMTWGVEPILASRFRAGGDLRHVLAATAKTGFSLADNVRRMLMTRIQPPEDEPINRTVWPTIATHFELLDDALRRPNTSYRWSSDNHALSTLDVFPKTPARCLDLLLDRAITGLPRVRAAARRRLEETGDAQKLILPLLGAGHAATRAKAAGWLGERRDPTAVAPLRAALADESALDVRAALLAALVACGEDVADQFSEAALTAEAEAGLRKTRVDYAALFDRNRLPALHWADRRAVPEIVVQWWFARADKLKRPTGDPWLHMALDRLDRGDAGRLGTTVLSTFIAADTQRPDLETANAFATAHVAQVQKQYGWVRKDVTPDMAFTIARNKKLAEYTGSALDHRGLLALSRHAPIAEAVAATHAYLRQHGSRSTQGKALVEALSANADPRAVTAIVAISRTHAKRGTRKHAAALVEAIAEANGWSALELADRMMPTADLDARRGLDLPIGGAVYRASLAAETAPALHLRGPDGSPIDALPRAKTAEEKAEGAAARKRIAAASKAVTEAIQVVTDRFYQAMCAGRIWSTESFAAIVLHHPIADLLAQRIVFVGRDAGGAVRASFRRLPDGSLTDVADGSVDPGGFASFALAHSSTLGDDAAEAWRSHFADYAIEPLFDQLTRPLIASPDREARRLDAYRNHVIGSLNLADVAERLGYKRGPQLDRGSFNWYEKRFIDLGFSAQIGTSDAPWDKTADAPVKLNAASLHRYRPNAEESYDDYRGVRLERVPPILLSEVWHDLKAIAAAGEAPDTNARDNRS